MAEDKTGENIQSAADSNAGAHPVAAVQQQTGEQDDVGDAGQQRTDAEKGQLAALEAERKKRQEAEQQVISLNQQFQILQANQARQQAQQDIFQQQNLADEDYVTVEQARQYVQQLQQTNQQQQQATNIQNFISQHPDYAEMVGQSNLTGQFIAAEPLRQALLANPALGSTLNNPLTAPIVAYELAKGQIAKTKLAEQFAANKEKEAQQSANEKIAPMSSAAVGGTGATNLASQIGDLSDPEHLKKLQKLDRDVMSGKFG